MISLGHQHIAEFLNCRFEALNNPEKLEQLLREAINYSGLHCEEIITHKFEPVGVTILAIISESHIGLHTYPESNHLSLDVFTCTDPKKNLNFIEYFKKKLTPAKVRIAQLQRGDSIEIDKENWITSASGYGFDVRYHIRKNIYSKESAFQLIDIIENESFGKMMFLDRDLQIAQSDAHLYSKSLIDPITEMNDNLKIALILGGGDGGILNELLKRNFEKVTLVDIDEEVIALSKKYLPEICGNAFDDSRVNVVISDVLDFLKSGNKYDAVVYDLTMKPGAFSGTGHPDFLNHIFAKVKQLLDENGILTLQIGSEYDTDNSGLVKKILLKHFKEVKFSSRYIPSFCESWMFGTASKKF